MSKSYVAFCLWVRQVLQRHVTHFTVSFIFIRGEGRDGDKPETDSDFPLIGIMYVVFLSTEGSDPREMF